MAMSMRELPRLVSLPLARRAQPAGDRAAAALLEYQWPSEAIINTPIPPMARNVTWVVTAMVLSMIGAMAAIPVDQVVSARGIVVSQTPTLLIQPLDTSIVRSIEVREGQA